MHFLGFAGRAQGDVQLSLPKCSSGGACPRYPSLARAPALLGDAAGPGGSGAPRSRSRRLQRAG